MQSEEMTVDWVDVDKDNTNISFLSTYVNDIFEHYRRREVGSIHRKIVEYIILFSIYYVQHTQIQRLCDSRERAEHFCNQ